MSLCLQGNYHSSFLQHVVPTPPQPPLAQRRNTGRSVTSQVVLTVQEVKVTCHFGLGSDPEVDGSLTVDRALVPSG